MYAYMCMDIIIGVMYIYVYANGFHILLFFDRTKMSLAGEDNQQPSQPNIVYRAYKRYCEVQCPLSLIR